MRIPRGQILDWLLMNDSVPFPFRTPTPSTEDSAHKLLEPSVLCNPFIVLFVGVQGDMLFGGLFSPEPIPIPRSLRGERYPASTRSSSLCSTGSSSSLPSTAVLRTSRYRLAASCTSVS